MTSKIFSVATFIVVSWLAVTVITTSNRVSALESNLLNGMSATSSAMNVRLSKLEGTQSKNHLALLAKLEGGVTKPPAPAPAQTQTQAQAPSASNNELKAEIEKLKQQIAKQEEFADLRKAYQAVIESELEKFSSPTDAAEKLLSTKSIIWETSTKYPAVKPSLRALMATIDVLAARWNSGDTKGTVQPVFKVLQKTLATLDEDI